ncbi:MAG: LysM peptidoglycan-binding domain-containing protein [Bacilli bacterium]|nr:LysM peptidoglycan-binding domain-containing protein [Bacilli bacterium]
MKKKVSFNKKIDFPTMIGEICEITLEPDLKFIDESNIEGNLLLSGKYKMTEASRLEEDFNYQIPVEIALTEKIDLNTSNIEISDFYYEIEEESSMICYIELTVDGLEIIDDNEEENATIDDRECDGDSVLEKEIEIPILEKTNEIEEEVEEVVDNDTRENINSLFSNLNDENETYGTFIVYIVRQNETINSIIEKYNTTIEELEKYNDIKDVNIGTKLIIPLVNE